MKHIKYKGCEICDEKGRVRLKSDTIYRLSHDWTHEQEINGHWIFYIYDEIGKNTNESFGFEIAMENIETLREYNLKSLLGTF